LIYGELCTRTDPHHIPRSHGEAIEVGLLEIGNSIFIEGRGGGNGGLCGYDNRRYAFTGKNIVKDKESSLRAWGSGAPLKSDGCAIFLCGGDGNRGLWDYHEF
jgi:hypothetical protein